MMSAVSIVSYMSPFHPYLPGAKATWKKGSPPKGLGHNHLNGKKNKNLSTWLLPLTCTSYNLSHWSSTREGKKICPSFCPTPNLLSSFMFAFFSCTSSASQHIPSAFPPQ